MLRSRIRGRGTPQCDVLLAKRRLALGRAQHAPATRIPLEHAGRLALACHRRCILGGQQTIRPDRLGLQNGSFMHCERAGGQPGQRGLFYQRRHGSRRDRRESRHSARQHLVLSRYGARDQANRFLRIRRFRHHPQGADNHRRHASFPLPELLAGQRQRQFLLF